ncbi:MAG: response regulator [Candidatus Methylomirabilis oxyfera]|nr:response regulator [Candidatus Methylomirabilis oxyfera]
MSAQERILVVDDDPEVRTLLSRRLRRAGYVVEEAGDGMDALGLVDKAVPDVVVTDMAMPRPDGLGLLKELRSRDPELPVIVLTGHGSLDNVILAMRDGSLFDYLLKPLPDLDLLDVAVRRALEVRQLRARAREADQVVAMRELAATASDRILNPLSAIMLSLVTLRQEGIAPQARATAAARVEQAIDIITRVVRQMRTVARYTPREVTRGLREIDLETATAEEQETD